MTAGVWIAVGSVLVLKVYQDAELITCVSCNILSIAAIWWDTTIFGAISRWWFLQGEEFCF